MRKFLRILVEVTYDAFHNIGEFISNNLLNFANILSVLLPFIMYFIGKNNFSIGPEIIISVIALILIYYAKNAANKIGKGITIPIPEKRFTEVDDEGEVSVENARLQEMLLYMADLEDWMQRKGLI